MSLQDDVKTAVDALNVVEQDVTNAEPTFADQVLAAVQPVFEAAGWTAPAPVTSIPVTDSSDTPPSA